MSYRKWMVMIALASMLLFAVIPQALADERSQVTTSDILMLVEQFNEEGAFINGSTVRALTMHLNAVNHYEQQAAKNKVVEHMRSFKRLLDYHFNHDSLTENAYNMLMEATDDLIQWQSILAIILNGESDYMIVLPDEPTQLEQSAANELQTYIQKAAGVKLEIVTEKDAGTKALMVGEKFAADHHILLEGEESWSIKAVRNKLVLTGGGERGVLYSVYHFLEDIVGVRWWTPWEEYVPQTNELFIDDNFETSGTPSFRYRDIYDSLYDVGAATNGIYEEIPEPNLFYVRNRLNGHFSHTPAEYGGTYSYGPPYHVHTFSHYFPAEQYFAEHPEWFSYSKSTESRIPNGQLCLTNEELLQEFVKKVKESIRISYAEADANGEPRPEMFSITQNDWLGGCECEDCARVIAEKGEAGHILSFVNDIADEVAEEYPDAKIETLAYSFYINPPKDDTKPNDNVVIRLASNRDILHDVHHDNNEQFRERLEAWSQLADDDNLFLWEYSVNYSINPPFPNFFRYGEDYKFYHDNNVKGMFVEQEDPISKDMWPLKNWVKTKLMENVHLDADELIDEFIYGYYGEAGDYIKQYLLLVEEAAYSSDIDVRYLLDLSSDNYIDLDLALESSNLLEAALNIVEGDPVLTRRVKHVRSFLDKAIVFKYNDFAREAKDRGIYETEFNLSKRESAQRVVEFLEGQIDFLSQYPFLTSFSTPRRELVTFRAVAREIVNPLPAELEHIPHESITEFSPEMFRLHPDGHGLSVVEDEQSLIGKAAKVTPAEVREDRKHYYEEAGFPIGVYSRTEGGLKSVRFESHDVKKYDEYMLYKLEDTRITEDSYLYVLNSWALQQDLDLMTLISEDPDVEYLYDVYVSIKYQGDKYGGNELKPDGIYIDRIFVVEKGPYVEKEISLPDELKDIPEQFITDFHPDTFRLSRNHGLSVIQDEESLVGKAAGVTYEHVPDQNKRYYEADAGVAVGVYSRSEGHIKNRQLRLADAVSEEYMLFKIEDTQIPEDSYLFVFNSWGLQVDLASALTGDPNQLYDVYVSMKWQGEKYGGSELKPDGMYVDRIVVVQKETLSEDEVPLPEELADIPREFITDFTPATFFLRNNHGLSLVEDEESLVGIAAKVTYEDVPEENKRYYEHVSAAIGVRSNVLGETVDYVQISTGDVIRDQYMLFKIADLQIPQDAYVYVLNSWGIQQTVGSALSDDPEQSYDVYVSIKFQGAKYGGSELKPSGIYVDRIIVVKRP